MNPHQSPISKFRKPYTKPMLTVQGDIAELTQSKSWGSGDSFIMSINVPGPIASIVNSVTHYS